MWNKILNSVVLSVCFIMQIVGYIVDLRELNVLTEPSSKWLAGCSNGKVKHHIQAPEGGSSEPWSPAIFSPEPGSPMIFYSGARIDFPSGALEPRSFALEPWSWLPLLVLFFVDIFFLFPISCNNLSCRAFCSSFDWSSSLELTPKSAVLLSWRLVASSFVVCFCASFRKASTSSFGTWQAGSQVYPSVPAGGSP